MEKTKGEKERDVLIIDYKVGNLTSITNALDHLGYSYLISDKKEDLEKARCYILPGVGAFNEAMKNIHQLGIIETLNEQVLKKKKPILGICLGMQILAEDSEENGLHKGLGWIKGKIVKISPRDKDLSVPHVGWNQLEIRRESPLFKAIKDHHPHFYFDHSYHFQGEEEFIVARCDYGGNVTAAIQKENIFGVQFHPEKSQNNGLRLYRGFFRYVEEEGRR